MACPKCGDTRGATGLERYGGLCTYCFRDTLPQCEHVYRGHQCVAAQRFRNATTGLAYCRKHAAKEAGVPRDAFPMMGEHFDPPAPWVLADDALRVRRDGAPTSSNASERKALTVHVGQVTAPAVLLEWWKGDEEAGQTEQRTVKFLSDRGIWLPGLELPESLEQAGALISKVAGVTHYRGLHSPRAAAGWWLRLTPEPSNPYDSNAIAVYTDDGVQVGYLPKEVAAGVHAEARRRNAAFGALVVIEFRHLDTRERAGIRVLVGPQPVWAEWPRPAP
jgi:hypothetical protein